MSSKLSAIIEKDQRGYFARCPELKGCHTQRDTLEEALANLQAATQLCPETFSLKDLSADPK